MVSDFKNGLLGHRVGGITPKNATIEGVFVGTINNDGTSYDRIVTDDGEIRLIWADRVILPEREDSGPQKADPTYADWVTQMAKDRGLTVDELIVWLQGVKVDRVDIPETNVVKPYSIESMTDVNRLTDEVLIPAGFSDFYSRQPYPDGDAVEWVIATKDGLRIMVNDTGVSLIMPSGETVYGIYIPLSEWVKNPTIESLLPPKTH